MPEPAAKPTRRYAAFLSYRHADNREDGRRWAEWLHQGLETYEVPRDLVGKPNLRGTPVPASLYPVFRDEEELPADADLSQNITRALDHSDLLIVLCSPRACQSQFVAGEIRYFKELGRSDRILALMLDGEPNADDPAKAALGITPEMECFPEPLRFGVPAGADGRIDWTQRTEPIAADVRPQNQAGQGYTSASAYRTALEKARGHSAAEIRRLEKDFAALLDLARLKLVAGALGLPLGQLRERDAVYRAKKFRRLAAILGSLALLALIAAGVAVWQRAEARQQQVRAEAGEKAAVAARERAVSAKKAADELITFMQYDLRDNLGQLGVLPMMEPINARIRRYHEEHPPEPGDQNAQDAADRERGVALEQEGNLLLERGKLADALKSHEESLAIQRRLAARNPADAGWQRDLSIGLDNVGNVKKAGGDLPAALGSYLESLAIRKKLASLDPADANRQHSVSTSLSKVGGVQEASGDLPAALGSYQESLAIIQKLAAQNPADINWQSDLSVSLEKIGNMQKAKGDLPAALRSYLDSLAIRKKLAAENLSADWQRELSIGFAKVASVQQLQRDLPAALTNYQENMAICQKLVTQDPTNAKWQRDLAVGFSNLGGVLKAKGDLDAALRNFQDSLAIFQKLAAQDPANADWQRDLSVGFERIGDVQENRKDLPAALQSYRDSLALVEKLAAKDPANAGWQIGVIHGEREVGDTLYSLDRKAEARGHFERSRRAADGFAAGHPANYTVQVERAYARWCFVDCSDTQSSASREEARRTLGEAVDILRAQEKSSGLQKTHAGWLHDIEEDLKKLD